MSGLAKNSAAATSRHSNLMLRSVLESCHRWKLNRTLKGIPATGTVVGHATFISPPSSDISSATSSADIASPSVSFVEAQTSLQLLRFEEDGELHLPANGVKLPIQQAYYFGVNDSSFVACTPKDDNDNDDGLHPKWKMWFPDGRDFLDLRFEPLTVSPEGLFRSEAFSLLKFDDSELATGAWLAAVDRHLCGDDTYDAHFCIRCVPAAAADGEGASAAPPLMCVHEMRYSFSVFGPHKEYVAVTQLLRDTA